MTDDELRAERDDLRDQVERLQQKVVDLEEDLVDPKCGACGARMYLLASCQCAENAGGGDRTPAPSE